MKRILFMNKRNIRNLMHIKISLLYHFLTYHSNCLLFKELPGIETIIKAQVELILQETNYANI